MNREEFLVVLDRQQQSGFSIKDFCDNEGYAASSFCYWKSKYGLTRRSGSRPSSGEFAPVSFRSGSTIPAKGSFEEESNKAGITIEFPNGVKIHFRGSTGSGTAIQVITQLCHSHVLSK